MSKTTTALIIICVVLLCTITAIAGYLYGVKTQKDSGDVCATDTTKTATYSATATTKPTEAVVEETAIPDGISDEEALKESIYREYGTSADTMSVTISKIEGSYATGSVGGTGSDVGGGYFVAAEVGGEWLIIADGNGVIECAVLDEYSVPASIIGECYDSATAEAVTR